MFRFPTVASKRKEVGGDDEERVEGAVRAGATNGRLIASRRIRAAEVKVRTETVALGGEATRAGLIGAPVCCKAAASESVRVTRHARHVIRRVHSTAARFRLR